MKKVTSIFLIFLYYTCSIQAQDIDVVLSLEKKDSCENLCYYLELKFTNNSEISYYFPFYRISEAYINIFDEKEKIMDYKFWWKIENYDSDHTKAVRNKNRELEFYDGRYKFERDFSRMKYYPLKIDKLFYRKTKPIYSNEIKKLNGWDDLSEAKQDMITAAFGHLYWNLYVLPPKTTLVMRIQIDYVVQTGEEYTIVYDCPEYENKEKISKEKCNDGSKLKIYESHFDTIAGYTLCKQRLLSNEIIINEKNNNEKE